MALARLPRPARYAILSIILVALSLRSVTYAARWNDRLSFYETSVRESPSAARLRVLLATELIDLRRFREADAVVAEGLRITPDYWGLWLLAARVAIEESRFADAERAIKETWARDPFVPDVLAMTMRLDEAQATTRPTR
jgi:predicted Zn-dependent protease